MKKQSIKILLPTLIIVFLLCVGTALSPVGEGIHRNLAILLANYLPLAGGTLSGDLNMDGNDIKMGAGLIGYDGTASKGLSFDSGNEKMVLESGQIILPAGSAAAPAVGWADTGFYEVAADVIGTTINGSKAWQIAAFYFQAGNAGGARLENAASSDTNPTVLPDRSHLAFGLGGTPGSGYISLITNSRETIRLISSADTDSDTDDVLSTGVSGYHGLVLIRSITDDTSAIFRVSNVTVVDVSLDGDHTSTKDTGAHYNFYYDTDQFKLQNKVGDNKSISVAFWVLPKD